ncbi:MAG: ParB/RepB/Spo0J family partition protein [Atopobium sp.]|nr:ParB/RepB/Spo0J family partition protein [Atopobium sp.]
MTKKSGLGKGLESLMGEANAEIGNLNPDSVVDISRIHPNKEQPRKNFDETSLSELSESIKRNGILQPLLVRNKGGSFEIIAGERRYQAAKKAGLKEIPVVIRDVSDDEVFQLALIENLQRSDLNPIEEAQGFKKMIEDEGLTQEELGQILSKSRSTIANSMRLLDLPVEIQKMMLDSTITAGHARAILAIPDQENRIRLAEKVVAENLTVRQTEKLAPLFSGKKTDRKTRQAMPQIYGRAARQLKLVLDRNVKIKKVRNKNKIEIEFDDEADLAHLVTQLSQIKKQEDETDDKN